MQSLYLIRGLPGSGKTTLARDLCKEIDNSIKIEADDFFTSIRNMREHYDFDRRFLGAAHDEAYGRTMRFLRQGMNVCVANTFSTMREIERYTNGVNRCGLDVDVHVVLCTGEWPSEHNVPRRAIEKMKARWENHPSEWVYNGE